MDTQESIPNLHARGGCPTHFKVSQEELEVELAEALGWKIPAMEANNRAGDGQYNRG